MMHGEPDRRLIARGPSHAMAASGRDEDVIAGAQAALRLAFEPQPGGVYAVDINDKALMRGEFVEVQANKRVVFTFGWEGQPIAPGSSTVQIDLEPRGKTTLVRLTHTGLPVPARADHADGWNHYLARLAIAVPGGDPGPDKNNMA